MTLFASVQAFRETGAEWLWPNFKPEELACRCCGEYYHDSDFLNKLQQMRNVWAKPLRINSGHRCPANNKRVGGAPSSRHLHIAADINLGGLSLTARRNLARIAIESGFTGIGRAVNFLHVDNRPGKFTEWYYGDSAKAW